jgi:hypothetical protein
MFIMAEPTNPVGSGNIIFNRLIIGDIMAQ